MACRYIFPKLGTRVRKTGTRVRNSHFLLFHAFWSVFMKKHTSPRANGAQTTPHAHTSEPCAPNATHDLRARLRGHWYVSIAIIIINNMITPSGIIACVWPSRLTNIVTIPRVPIVMIIIAITISSTLTTFRCQFPAPGTVVVPPQTQ